MSALKNSFQYDSAYNPKVLRNWEVPKFYCDKPQRRTGKTKVIANTRGHLLPGISKSQKSPWGNFVGTWQLPKKIDRKTAQELSDQKCIKKSIKQTTKILDDNVKASTHMEEDNLVEEDQKQETLQVIPYVPGDLTEEKHRLSSHDILAKNRYNLNEVKTRSNGYPKCRNDFSRKSPEPAKDLSDQVNEFYNIHKEMVNTECAKTTDKSKKERLLSPILAAISNFSLAKKLHKENLEHVPLPDTVAHSMYKRLQMQRNNGEPGLALEDQNFASGVGWKGYPGYGPTKCTKLKVYRPQTCDNKRKHKYVNDRPSSVSSFDKKWRFIKQSKVSPIDLAICWDLTPDNPLDEPKRTTHIDGSNGSMAPAVFSLVNTPKDEETVEKEVEANEKCDGIHGCGPIFEHGPKISNGKDFILNRPQSVPRQNRSKNSSIKSDESSSIKKRAKSAYDIQSDHQMDETCSNCSNEINKQVDQNRHSTPNLSDSNESSLKSENTKMKRAEKRLCVACDLKNVSIRDKRPKNDYKMAFKAGVPHKVNVSKANCKLKVPKQKNPYSPKNYAIDSLAPPFSLQKDKRQDYPEHWRLATVYQHSYKPIYARKRPLLSTVFK